MALPKGVSILQELQRLRDVHASSKVDSTAFQPKEVEQKKLIVKNAALKIVNLALKREKTKYLFNEKQRVEEELKREAEGGQSMNSKKRPFTSPTKGSDMSMIYSKQKSFYRLRPNTASQVEGKATSFARVLKSAESSDDIAEQIKEQATHEAKNAQKLFNLLCTNVNLGVVCQFSPKRPFEEVDVSHLVASPSLLTGGNKMDALASLRKKDGILIIIDPSTYTESRAVTIKIRYMKQVDIAVEEAAEKEVTFWSNGNYFGLRLTKDVHRSNSEVGSQLLSGKPYTRTKIMMPGWTPAAPIFLPNTNKCSFHWADINQFVDSAAVSNRLSRLRLFAISCPTAKVGMRRITEYLDQQMVRETANLSLPGGIPALHYAAMHGNIDAVHLLVQNGANINFRCKEDKSMTALHQAVMAGQAEIVLFLLEQGASQLLRDDSGMGPLHLACKFGHTSIARMLMDHGEGKRALQMVDHTEHKPIDLCANHFLKSAVEIVMRRMHIFVKPRVSLYER